MYLRVRKFGAETSDRSVASSRETAQQTRGDRAKRKTRGARKVGCIENGGEGGGDGGGEEVVDGEKTRWRGQQQNHAEAGGLLAGRLAVKIEICTDSSMRGGERLKRARKCLGPED